MIIPRRKAPELIIETLDHGRFNLAMEKPERLTLVCFYRGLHCPVCTNYLKELERLTPAFAQRGVETIAVSSDGEARARQMAEKIAAKNLRVGYGLELSAAREWGLYISASRGKSSIDIEEPPMFSEPGVFLIRPDQTIYYLSVQSMPFVRPNFGEMLQAVDYIIKTDYPARGEYAGPV
ncbi:peroxiredoxin-like family protein [Mesorhizobium sp. M2C.T.Ca.TU.002.02.1.1]|uniref:peroxiredoxin-like family protein n=1 Tax=Mesorhizobium sp. M2C.T.Ca.TU.002.02.1.1 TaxID=2496788 RepID=UPI000FCA6225|nr:peroxiredoxin-like family protein [Mesorhizobium sp. M2C.T.Ca.TU.002.02.1.1]RUU59828.1 AhpC/TSA family protein [Mesorhizobium sp. M2C.T.Ca.TU.002.02.1.1]RUU70910.1 AhpC/TSA family protein [Mesorhizobium sp. M2C.T.Ca.TU.009.01.2.1]